MDNHLNAFMTHNGLKVRLNHEYCISDMTDEAILAWYTSIEAFDSLRSVLAIIVSFFSLAVGLSPINSAFIICVAYLIGYWISQSFFYMVILNLIYGYFYMLYQFMGKFFIQYVALIIYAIIKKDYWFLVAYIVARVACYIILHLLSLPYGRYIYKKYGVIITDVEVTAIKLLKFYSENGKNFKNWLANYSRFMDGDVEDAV